MRRVGAVDLMLLATVVLWALNLTVSRYLLTHGFEPLAYSTLRYGAAALVFLALTLVLERALRVARKDLALILAAALFLWLNQVAFVYALEQTTASTVGLILGSIPIFAAIFGIVAGIERLGSRFWLAAFVSFAGVALVATGSAGGLSGDVLGNVLGVATAATWAGYSVAIAPLMRRYSPSRVSAVVLALAWAGLAATGAGQTVDQDLELGWGAWVLFSFAVLGPLVLTNVLWFRSLHRIGPSRAALAVNLQPFVAAVFALVLLSEAMTGVQVAGGVLIALGIVLTRLPRPSAAVAAE